MSSPSLLPFVKAADSFPDYISQPSAYPLQHPETGEVYVPFHLCPADYEAKLTPLGLLRPNVVQELRTFEAESKMGAFSFVMDADEVRCVTFTEPVVAQGTESMNQAVATAAWTWRQAGKFKNELDGEYKPEGQEAGDGAGVNFRPFLKFNFYSWTTEVSDRGRGSQVGSSRC